MRICALARAEPRDLDRCHDALRHAPLARIHTFLASSDLHLEHRLGMTRAECVEHAAAAVRHARAMCDDVQFSAEDASRSDPNFLAELCQAVAEAGATTLNLSDSVGYSVPEEMASQVAHIKASCKAVAEGCARISVHCHDDLGLATANTLAARWR
jgi:2-isopropylmalate synthase